MRVSEQRELGSEESDARRRKHPPHRRPGGGGAERRWKGSQNPRIEGHNRGGPRGGGGRLVVEAAEHGITAAITNLPRLPPPPPPPLPPPRPHPGGGVSRRPGTLPWPGWSRSHCPPGGPFLRRPRPPAHTVSVMATMPGEGAGHGGAAGLSPQLMLSVYTPAIPFVMYIIVNIICKYIEFKRMIQVHRKWT